MQKTSRTLSLLTLVFLAGCQRASPDAVEPARPPVTPNAAEPALAKAIIQEEVRRFTSKGRVVAIGDVHGDLAATRAALRLAGAINEQDQWVGGDLFVVQTGDHLDRGDDEPQIATLFLRLEAEARDAGGAFIVLLGNHELMNAAGDFRYVTPDGLADFGGEEGRRRAFGPGGDAARSLGQLSLYAIVDDTLFSHAGVSPRDLDLGLEELSMEARAWLRREEPKVPRALLDSEGIVWTRRYGGVPAPEDCAAAREVLARLKLARMVVGHSPQPHINAVCEGTVWRIDVGLARHYGGPVEILAVDAGVASTRAAVAGEPGRVKADSE